MKILFKTSSRFCIQRTPSSKLLYCEAKNCNGNNFVKLHCILIWYADTEVNLQQNNRIVPFKQIPLLVEDILCIYCWSPLRA